MSSDTQNHPFHMVEPSPWPLIGSIAALVLAPGAIIYMHDGTPIVMLIGFAILFYTFFGWWRQVVRESTAGKYHTGAVSHGLRFGMVLFIASEVMFFFAFFWAFFHSSVPALSLVANEVWPPEGVVPFNPWSLPFLNTLILLTSGATVTYAHHAIRMGDHGRCAKGLLLTVCWGRCSRPCRPTNTATPHSGSPTASIRRRSIWRPASTAFT
jgi:cytochrome c oxidase subunit 3